MSTRSATDKESFFATSKATRDAHCGIKDHIIGKILDGITIRAPKAFHAVLMPSLYGPEVETLRSRGVPLKNLFAIERDPAIHAKFTTLKRLQGLQTTPRPLAAQAAIDHVPFASAQLVYLDFFGQPDFGHFKALYKLFKLGVCRRGTTLITTFGVNRGETFSCLLNTRLKNVEAAGQAYIEAAMEKANIPRYRMLRNHAYKTAERNANFVTTEVHL